MTGLGDDEAGSFYLEYSRRNYVAQLARRVCPGRHVADLGAQPFILSCTSKALLRATVKRPANIHPLRVAAYPLAKTAPSLRTPIALIGRKTQREHKAIVEWE